MNAANRNEIWKTGSQTRSGSKDVPLQERWVEALLSPGGEIQASGQELVDFAMEIGLWREPLFRFPKIELGDDPPAICLTQGGEGFWKGGKLRHPRVPRDSTDAGCDSGTSGKIPELARRADDA